MVAVTVTTTPIKLVESNRHRTSLTINNADGNDGIFLLDNMDSNSKIQQLTGGASKAYNISSALVGTNIDGSPRYEGQRKVTQAHYAVASTGSQTVYIEQDWGGSK
jgi:hypothetical protein